jgi:hypothetical protein
MLLHELLKHRSISDPTFLHLIHSFREEALPFSVYHFPFLSLIDVCLLVYDLSKQVGSQGSKVIQLVTAYVALPHYCGKPERLFTTFHVDTPDAEWFALVHSSW